MNPTIARLRLASAIGLVASGSCATVGLSLCEEHFAVLLAIIAGLIL